MEDWSAIASDAAAAIAENGVQVLVTRQTSPEPQTPWDTTPIEATTFAVTAVDLGIRRSRAGGEIAQARVLLVAAGDIVPEIGDMVTVRDRAHAVLSVMPTAPGGVDAMHKVEIKI